MTKIITVPFDSAKANYQNLGFNLVKPKEPTTYYSVVSDKGQCLAMAVIRKVKGSTIKMRMNSANADFYLLSGLLVDEKHRSKGIGSNLLKHLMSAYKDLYLNVEKSNERAYKLYKKLGFTYLRDNMLKTPHYLMGYQTTPRGYCSLGLTKPSEDLLRSLFKPYMELDVDLHCTLMFDENLAQNYWGDIPNKEYTAKSLGLTILGQDSKSIVLELRSPEIQKRFTDLSAVGYTHSFPSLLIHITLQYGQGTTAMLDYLNNEIDKGRLVLPKKLTLLDEQWDILDD